MKVCVHWLSSPPLFSPWRLARPSPSRDRVGSAPRTSRWRDSPHEALSAWRPSERHFARDRDLESPGRGPPPRMCTAHLDSSASCTEAERPQRTRYTMVAGDHARGSTGLARLGRRRLESRRDVRMLVMPEVSSSLFRCTTEAAEVE